MVPALLTSASMRSVCFKMDATKSAASFCVPLLKSAFAAINSPPAALTCEPVSAKSLRATPTTFAPSRANATQIACPIPWLAPVTTVTFLLNRFVSTNFYAVLIKNTKAALLNWQSQCFGRHLNYCYLMFILKVGLPSFCTNVFYEQHFRRS